MNRELVQPADRLHAVSHPRIPALSKERRHALMFPREHGAWGILLIPLCTGAAVALLRGGRVAPVVLFFLAALVLFWMRTPVESWLGTGPMRAQSTEEIRLVQKVTFLLACGAVVLLAALFWHGRNSSLFVLGAVAAAAFVAQAVLKKVSRKTRVLSQVVGAIGLTCTAPGAYYVSTTHLGPAVYGLWLANWIFAANQVHYVQTRIHGTRVQGFSQRCGHAAVFLTGTLASIGLLLAAMHERWLPPAVLLAFAPALAGSIAWFFGKPETLAIHRLGWMEMAQALFFGAALVATFSF